MKTGSDESSKLDENSYKELFSHMIDGFALHKIIVDNIGKPIDYEFLEVNSAFEKMTELKKENIIGKRVTAALPGIEKDPADWIRMYGKVALTGKSIEFENYSVALKKWFKISAYSPKKGYFTTIFEDITKRKETEEKEKENSKMIRTLTDDLPGFIAYVDIKTLKYLFVNKAYQKAFGMPQNKIIGSHIKKIIGEAGYKVASKYIEEVRKGKSASYENIIDMKEGKRWIKAIYTPGFDNSGKVISIIAMSYDITEQKKAEEKLKSITQNNPDHILVQDKDLRYEFVLNPQVGLTEKEMIGKTDFDFLPKKDAISLSNLKKKVMTTEKPLALTLPVHNKKGETEYFEGTYIPRENHNGVIGYFKNVTEKKKTEILIKESEEKFKTLLKSIPIPTYTWQKQGDDLVLVDYNNMALTFTHGTIKKFVGIKLNDMYKNTSWQNRQIKSDIKQCLHDKTIIDRDMDYQLQSTHENKFLHVKYAYVPPNFVIVHTENITERKKAEEEIINSQKLLQRIIDLLPIRIFWKDTHSVFLGCNNIFANDAGKKYPKELIGKDDFQMNWKAQAKSYIKDDQKTIKSGKSILNYEEEQTTPKGNKIWLKTSKIPLTDSNGKTIGILGSYEDITERKKAEEMLIANKSKLDLALKSAKMGVWQLDLTLNKRDFDNQTCHLLGINPSTFKGTAAEFYKVVHPDDIKQMKIDMTNTINKNVLYEPEYRVIWPDKSIHYITARAELIHDSNGKPKLINGILWDITERKKVETELKTYNNSLSKLNQFVIELSYASTEENIERLIAKRIKEISGAEVAIFSEYNPKDKTTNVKHIEMDSVLHRKVVSLLGKQITNIHSVVSDKMYKRMTTELIEVRKSLYEVSFKSIPRPVSSAIQKLLKVNRFIVIAYLIEGRLYGTSLLAMKECQPDPSMDLLKNFINMAALAIRRKILDVELKESEEKYKSIFNNSAIGMYRTKLDGSQVLEFNDKYCSILGVTHKEVEGKPSNILWVHPEERKKMVETLKASGQVDELQFQLKRKDGKIIDAVTSVRLYQEQGVLEGSIIDITEKKLAEEKLKESEERYKLLVDRMQEITVILDKTGKILFANRFTLENMGYTEKEFFGKSVFSFLTKNSIKTAIYNLSQEFLGRNMGSIEVGVITKKGEIRTIALSKESNPIYKDKKIVEILINGLDITEQRKAEDLNKNIIKCTTDWIWEVNLQGKYTYCSENVKNILGYDIKEIIGKTPFDFMTKEEVGRIGPVFEEIVKKQKSIKDLENWNVHKDGHKVCLLTNGFPVFDENGKLKGYRGADKDITEIKEAGDKYKRLVELTKTGYLILDYRGNVIDANQEYVRLSGRNKLPDILGRNVIEWTAKYEEEKSNHAIKQCLKDGFIFGLSIDYIDKKDKITSVEINAFAEGEGKNLQLISLCRDITERKESENILKSQTALLEAQLNSSSDGILIVDNKGNKILQNQRCIDLWKIPKQIANENDDSKQLEFVKNRTKDPKMFVDKVIYLYSHPDEISHDEVEFKDGMVLERYSAPILDKDKNKYGRIWAFHDITERKLAEEDLRASEEKYRAILNSSTDQIFMIDKNLQYISINNCLAESLEKKQEDIIGKTIKEIFTRQNESKRLTDHIKKTLEGESPTIEEEIILRGKKNFISTQLNPIKNNAGIVTAVLGISRNITDRKKAEEELKASSAVLQDKINDLERFNRISIDRELKMIELKHKIKELEEKLEKK